MDINTLSDTCSMDELSEPSVDCLNNKLTFLQWLSNRICDNNDPDESYDPDYDELNKLQCIIYNCKERKIEDKLHSLGFRKKHSYIGNDSNFDGTKCRINVWFLNITTKLRKEIKKQRL